MAVDIFETLCWSVIVVDATCMLKEVDFSLQGFESLKKVFNR